MKGPYLLRKHENKEHSKVRSTWIDSDSDENYHPSHDRPNRKRKRSGICGRASRKRTKNSHLEAGLAKGAGSTSNVSFAEQDLLPLQHSMGSVGGNDSDPTEPVNPTAPKKEERVDSVVHSENDMEWSQGGE